MNNNLSSLIMLPNDREIGADIYDVSLDNFKAHVSVTGTVPSLPVVVITSPSNGNSFKAGSNTDGSNVTITASAWEANGKIVKVDFYYNGSNLLGTSTSYPHKLVVNNIPAGTYYLTVVATDASGKTVKSNCVKVKVTAN